MVCKKVMLHLLIIGAVVGVSYSYMNNSLDYKIRGLKRKLNCVNKKLNRALSSMSEENLRKYKQELLNGYENIKTKVENITIKDIKEAGSELIDNIVDSINNLKQKLITYSN